MMDPWRGKSWCHRDFPELSNMLAALVGSISTKDSVLITTIHTTVSTSVDKRAKVETRSSLNLKQNVELKFAETPHQSWGKAERAHVP